MDTLFNTKFESDPATHNEPGVRLKARSYELQESNVRLKLTIVDTVGFGDQINKDDRCVLRFCGNAYLKVAEELAAVSVPACSEAECSWCSLLVGCDALLANYEIFVL